MRLCLKRLYRLHVVACAFLTRQAKKRARLKNGNGIERFGCGRRLLHDSGNPVLPFCARVHLGHGGLIAVTVGGNIMRATLAVAVGFCLAFPLSAGAASGACTPGAQATCAQAVNSDFSAARRHPGGTTICPPRPLVSRLVCECELSGGTPAVYTFPFPQVVCYSRGLHQ